MKGSRLVDVLEKEGVSTEHRQFWEKMFGKMKVLLGAMETAKGNYDIDDPEIRWVSDRIEYWNSEERILSKDEMLTANLYWKTYGK